MAAPKKQKANKPYKKTPKIIKTKEEMLREKLLSDDFEFYTKEAYKTLRTKVTFSLPYDGCKKLLVEENFLKVLEAISDKKFVMPPMTNPLKDFTFAQTGAKVLLIDCDLRRPNLHRLFGANAEPGLSNALVGLNNINETIRHSVYENLDYIMNY